MGWQSIRIVGASASVTFILHQKIKKMAKCTFWFTRVVPDIVQRLAESHKMVVVVVGWHLL